MAPRKSPSAGDARSRGRSRDEWSCVVCTLLNNWRERRCGACDSERPADADSQPTEWSCEVCTLVNEWVAQRCAACEHERPTPTASEPSGAASKSPQVPTIAHRSSILDVKEGAAAPTRPSRKRALSPAFQRSSGALAAYPENKLTTPPPSPPSRASTTKNAADAQGVCHDVEDADPSVEGLPEAPTFNLLSFMTESAPRLAEPPMEDRGVNGDSSYHDKNIAASPSFNLLGGPTVDLTETSHDKAPNPREAEDSENQLAKAGLMLSDSESERSDDEHRGEKRLIRRRLSHQRSSTSDSPDVPAHESKDEWECSICTNINPAHCARCELCNARRDRLDRSEETSSDPVRDSVYKMEVSGRGSDTSFTCVVCTNINPGHLDQCEMCETKRQTVACPVCTTLNAVDRKRCEVCESIIDGSSTIKQPRPTSDAYIDLAVSQNDEYEESRGRYRGNSFDSDSRIDHESVGDFDDEFDDPYETHSTPPKPSSRGTYSRTDHHHDDIEDIFDNDIYGRMPVDTQQPAPSRRPELREFEHFLSVDDARLDYQCQIDYRSMFAESSRSRSYADRLQKRRRESQKRKRAAAEYGNGGQQTDAGRGKASGKKKASKAGGKKAKATERRSSTGRASARSTKKSRKEPKPRRSSAPAVAAGINHYDAVGDDFGDDITTMAWEGIGSAGYF